jgi:hypothetical protein
MVREKYKKPITMSLAIPAMMLQTQFFSFFGGALFGEFCLTSWSQVVWWTLVPERQWGDIG